MTQRPPYARRRLVAGLVVLGVVAIPLLVVGDEDRGSGRAATTAPPVRSVVQLRAEAVAARLPLARAVGQTVAGRYRGPTPSRDVTARVRRGELGAVILFSDNTAGGVVATRRAVDGLQAAAEAGGNPRLLVMTDQEGGSVKRLPGAPDRAAAAMDTITVARSEGQATGRLLRRAGVTLDLAPVVDVPPAAGSFLGTRAFAADPVAVADRACAFAGGVRSAGVAVALKHFPGLGRARGNTDDGRITIRTDADAIRRDLVPYRRCGALGLTAVMLSSATYPALLGAGAPAVLTAATYARELPRAGVPSSTPTISDDLDAGAIAGRDRPAHRALRAGLDLLLFARTEASSARAYRTLLTEARSGALSEARVRDAAAAVLALKGSLPPPSP